MYNTPFGFILLRVYKTIESKITNFARNELICLASCRRYSSWRLKSLRTIKFIEAGVDKATRRTMDKSASRQRSTLSVDFSRMRFSSCVWTSFSLSLSPLHVRRRFSADMAGSPISVFFGANDWRVNTATREFPSQYRPRYMRPFRSVVRSRARNKRRGLMSESSHLGGYRLKGLSYFYSFSFFVFCFLSSLRYASWP